MRKFQRENVLRGASWKLCGLRLEYVKKKKGILSEDGVGEEKTLAVVQTGTVAYCAPFA